MVEQRNKALLWFLLAILGIGALIGIITVVGGLRPTQLSKKCKLSILYDYTGDNLGEVPVDLIIKEKTTNSVVKEWVAVDCDYTPNKLEVDFEIDKGTYILIMDYPSRAMGIAKYENYTEFTITDTDLGTQKTIEIELNITISPPPPQPITKTLTVQLVDGTLVDMGRIAQILNEAGILVSVQIADASGHTQTISNVSTDATGKAKISIPVGWCVDSILVQKPGDPDNVSFAKCMALDDETKGLTMNNDRTVYIPFYGANDGDAGSILLILYNNEQKPDSTPWIAVRNDEIDETIHEFTEDYGLYIGRYLHIGPYFPFPEPGWHFECARDDYPNIDWRFQYININTWHVVIMDKPVANTSG